MQETHFNRDLKIVQPIKPDHIQFGSTSLKINSNVVRKQVSAISLAPLQPKNTDFSPKLIGYGNVGSYEIEVGSD